jgi:antitoxin VapB
MLLTRAFKSGNSQAVRIPAEIAYEELGVDLLITRNGNVITIAPAKKSMRDVVATLRAMPKPPSVEVYEPMELPDREKD